MIPEAPLQQTDAGLVPAGKGWFVLNARDAWRRREGRGETVSFTGTTHAELKAYFPQLGVNLLRLGSGELMSMYHGKTTRGLPRARRRGVVDH
jgi:hypothetical protein